MNFSGIPILLQNDEIVAVDKPAGLSVHNNEDPQNVLIVLEKQLEIKKLYPVHRLDKETSGVQILALTEAAAKKWAMAFEQKSVIKIYQGIVRGELKITSGAWIQPLTDKAEGRRSPSGHPQDRIPCETQFRVVKQSKYFTWCEFNLITGRQHQIRKHTALINHSLVGDPRYGDIKYNQKIAKLYKEDGLFLHCAKMEIFGQTINSPVPDKFNKLFPES